MSPSVSGGVRTVPNGLPPRRVAEALFPDASIRYVDRFDAIADRFDEFSDQRPATCGAYAVRYLLDPLGFSEHDGNSTIREDYLALLAGTIIEEYEVEPAERVRATVRTERLSEEAALIRFPDTYYAWPLRSSSDPTISGTSPTGVARAVALGSGGALATLPIPARQADGQLLMDDRRWNALLDLVAERMDDWKLHPIANYEADQLLDPASETYAADRLVSPDPDAAIPRDTWGVGHFAGIGAVWRTSHGRAWILLLDTYKGRGFRGYEPQPADLLQRGLVREDGRAGGLLVVLPREHLQPARDAVEQLGLEVRMWGNGSLEPADWTWSIAQ